MEKLSQNIAYRVVTELDLDKDNREVIAYGAFAILQMLLSIILVTIIGYLFNVVVQALIISFTASILRKCSGGAHSSSPRVCVVVGTIICIGLAVTATILCSLISFKTLILIGSAIFMIAFYAIYKLAPVDSPSKPIKKIENIKRMKRGSVLILSVYLIIAVINMMLYICLGYNKFLICTTCMYVAILWQVFTLTSFAHIVLTKIDAFFINIFFRKEGIR